MSEQAKILVVYEKDNHINAVVGIGKAEIPSGASIRSVEVLEFIPGTESEMVEEIKLLRQKVKDYAVREYYARVSMTLDMWLSIVERAKEGLPDSVKGIIDAS